MKKHHSRITNLVCSVLHRRVLVLSLEEENANRNCSVTYTESTLILIVVGAFYVSLEILTAEVILSSMASQSILRHKI